MEDVSSSDGVERAESRWIRTGRRDRRTGSDRASAAGRGRALPPLNVERGDHVMIGDGLVIGLERVCEAVAFKKFKFVVDLFAPL